VACFPAHGQGEVKLKTVTPQALWEEKAAQKLRILRQAESWLLMPGGSSSSWTLELGLGVQLDSRNRGVGDGRLGFSQSQESSDKSYIGCSVSVACAIRKPFKIELEFCRCPVQLFCRRLMTVHPLHLTAQKSIKFRVIIEYGLQLQQLW
jgi:hypothetical protein